MMICTAIGLLCLLLVAYSYLLFPCIMKRAAGRSHPEFEPLEEFPAVSVLVAAYNEDRVLEEKIRSIFHCRYPKHKLEIWVGSDASTDQTDAILSRLATDFSQLKWKRFVERTGKPGIINELAQEASGQILVVTDADALFTEFTMAELVLPFSNPKVGAVQAHAEVDLQPGGDVGAQELAYTRREMRMKEGESTFGSVIGGFGAAYALRKNLFRSVPPGFVVDDFFTFSDLLSQGYQTIFAVKARVILGVSTDSRVQFRRKRRIGRGNFQNLWHFRELWLGSGGWRIAWLFWSHKGIRWLTPLLVILFCVSVAIFPESIFRQGLVIVAGVVVSLSLFDLFLSHLGIHRTPTRYLRHFVWMNLALMAGLWDALTKKRAHGSWDNQKPTDRPAL
jgi:cellulose synthase/poly-beta-1,6-N-acetylglucosamine synthase-like glycosyltransferase